MCVSSVCASARVCLEACDCLGWNCAIVSNPIVSCAHAWFRSISPAGSFSLGQVGPNFAAYASARNAAFKLYAIIDRVPVIDVASDEGQKPAPSSLKGTIEFRNVSFAYPTRPTEKILTNFSVVIVGGTSVAIVGESGEAAVRSVDIVWLDA